MENNYIRTTYEKNIVIHDIETLVGHLYDTHKKDLETLLRTTIGEFSYEYLMAKLQSRGIEYLGINPISLRAHLTGILDELHSLQEVRITIAITPDETLLNTIHQWLQQNIGPQTIANIRTDHSILAGAIISIDGHYTNGSVNKKLASYFENKRQQLNEHRTIEDLFQPLAN